MRNLIISLFCLLTTSLSFAYTIESTANKTFEVTQVENMEDYTEGARLALGMTKRGLLLFNEGDETALVLSCEQKTLDIVHSRYDNIVDKTIDVGRKSKCFKLRELILKANASVENKITFVFNHSQTELVRVILP